MKSLIERRLFSVLIGFIGVLIVIAGVFVTGNISPREMGYAFTVACFTAIVILTLLFSKTNKEARPAMQPPDGGDDIVSRKKTMRAIRSYKFAIAGTAILFVYALWATRNDPLLPRIVGAAINIAILSAFIIALKAQKAKLSR